MKTFIITLTKALNHKTKVEATANSKKDIIEKLSKSFGLGIAPITEKDIVLKSDLPSKEQDFHYEVIDLNEFI